jgi:hypothetical protein
MGSRSDVGDICRGVRVRPGLRFRSESDLPRASALPAHRRRPLDAGYNQTTEAGWFVYLDQLGRAVRLYPCAESAPMIGR